MQTPQEATLTQARIEHILHLMKQLEQNLPFLLHLSPGERKKIYRKGDKQLEYIRKTLKYSRQLPHLVPSYVDVGKLGHDLYIGEQLDLLAGKLSTLVSSMEDTRMFFYEQAFESSRLIYQSFRNASRNNMKQASDAVEDLKQYFPRTGKTIQTGKEDSHGSNQD
ncbi:MAG: hypothetical protein R6V49_03780 [Bacteroidales bacterium]